MDGRSGGGFGAAQSRGDSMNRGTQKWMEVHKESGVCLQQDLEAG